jgi:hypothetical protein
LAPVGVFVFLLLVFYRIWNAIFFHENWIRLYKPFLLARGFDLYPHPDQGPVTSAIYGPVSTIAFLPATFFSAPAEAVRMAQTLGASFFFLPALWVCLGSCKDRRYALLGFLCFGLAPFLMPSLRNAAFLIHVDAPTLGLGMLACAFLYFRNTKNENRSLFLSALCVALAVWSKQVMAPLAAGLLVYCWLAGGRMLFLKYFGFLAGLVFTVSAVFIGIFGFEDLWFHLVTLPSRHPWKEGGGLPAFSKVGWTLLRESAALWFALYFVWVKRPKRPEENRWMVFAIAALAMIPAAVLGFIKIGGSRNTLSYVNYFLLAAVVSGVLLGLRKEPAQALLAKKAIVIAAGLLILIQSGRVFVKYFIADPGPAYALAAYDYAKRHPDQAYFPRLPLVSLLAEGKAYHDTSGLMDRAWAGLPISDTHFRAHIPKNLKSVAFIEPNVEGSADDWGWVPLPEFGGPYENPELPRFRVYQKPS